MKSGAELVKQSHLRRIRARARKLQVEIGRSRALLEERAALHSRTLEEVAGATKRPSAVRTRPSNHGFGFLAEDGEQRDGAGSDTESVESCGALHMRTGDTVAETIAAQPESARATAAGREAILRKMRAAAVLGADGRLRVGEGADLSASSMVELSPAQALRLRDAGASEGAFREHLVWLAGLELLASDERVDEYIGILREVAAPAAPAAESDATA